MGIRFPCQKLCHFLCRSRFQLHYHSHLVPLLPHNRLPHHPRLHNRLTYHCSWQHLLPFLHPSTAD
ncbi:hypothetical protein RchiOBHm_Chr3g0462141 [Rosa chinensis]|uniref:Uncharacterized protein n=1 Tax=Rosa chinensis TaxID=74649 RepID=A0A2P6R8U1_ROSCH|nr:hypothetical protein RchiOBHm_Chr3g0462141 [Rosa chinensis]